MKHCFIFVLLGISRLVSGQEMLEQYIRTGLENNLSLNQKEINYRQSLEAIKEARSLFFPSLSVNARYTVSEGGRVIDFPVGSMINPLYQGIYALTNEPSYNIAFENQQIRFLRPTEQETKLRLIQPLFNTDLYYNNRIKKELSVAEEITLGQYRRELIAEIRKAYYTVGMSQSLMNMYHQTRMLLVENIRVNTRLVENNKVTRDILLRSQTELSKFDQSLQDAEKNRKVSVAYFNFLLNRPLGDSVIIESPSELLPISGQTESFISSAVDNREEIKKLEQYNRINQLTTRMNQSGKLPNLMVVADYGFQGEKYAFNKDQDYLQASAILSWDLFNGFQNRVKIKQSEMNQERIVQQIEEAKQGIALQVISALESVKTAEAGLVAAKAQVSTAREAFRLVMRKYEEGQASLIEFMDARNSMTQAEENLIISVYTCLSFKAEFEKVIAAKTE